MNVIYIGLQVVQKDLKEELTATMTSKISTTVKDMFDSCGIITRTLNEVTEYENIEGGSLELELADALIMGFVFDAVRPFLSQVRNCVRAHCIFQINYIFLCLQY